MLKTRLIPTLLLKNGRMVKGKQFSAYRDTGHPVKAAQIYSDQYVDELIFLDTEATQEARNNSFSIVRDVAKQVFIPFTLGGGIRSEHDVAEALRSGADKVAITTAAHTDPAFIEIAVDRFGSQCIVAGMDVKKIGERYEVFTHNATQPTGLDPLAYAKRLADLGVGEILVQAVDRDGTMEGYDIMLIRMVADAVHIPVIALGGAGKLDHFTQALTDGNATAVSASSIFHFTDQSPIKVRSYLKSAGFDVRAK